MDNALLTGNPSAQFGQANRNLNQQVKRGKVKWARRADYPLGKWRAFGCVGVVDCFLPQPKSCPIQNQRDRLAHGWNYRNLANATDHDGELAVTSVLIVLVQRRIGRVRVVTLGGVCGAALVVDFVLVAVMVMRVVMRGTKRKNVDVESAGARRSSEFVAFPGASLSHLVVRMRNRQPWEQKLKRDQQHANGTAHHISFIEPGSMST